MYMLEKKKDLISINLSVHLKKLEKEDYFEPKANIRKNRDNRN